MEAPGRTFGSYKVVAPLGRGGMATVYRAENVQTGEHVALKTVRAANEKVVQSIRREVRALSRINGLAPRWGGSHEQMDSVAHEAVAHADDNPWLRTLLGAADLDRCHTATENRDYEAARQACLRAREHGDRVLTYERIALLDYFSDDYAAALSELEALIRLSPQTHLRWKVHVLSELERYEESALTFLEHAYMNPADIWVLEYAEAAANHLQVAAWEHLDAGERWKALDLLDVALCLTPREPALQDRLNHVILTASDPGASTAEELAQIARDDPDNFQAHRDYDYALARTQSFAEVAVMWDEFIARNPQEGRAYLERAGARRRLQHPDTLADIEEACRLGVAQACVHLAESR